MIKFEIFPATDFSAEYMGNEIIKAEIKFASDQDADMMHDIVDSWMLKFMMRANNIPERNEISKTVDYKEALLAIVNGKKIYRKEWQSKCRFIYQMCDTYTPVIGVSHIQNFPTTTSSILLKDNNFNLEAKTLALVTPYSRFDNYKIGEEDKEANDWVILD